MNTGNTRSAHRRTQLRRAFIVAVYCVAFWVVLPGLLLITARILDTRFALELPESWLRTTLGLVLFLGATALLLLSIREYRTLTGEFPVSALPSQILVETGPYAVWRHPIYLGFTLLWFSVGFLLGSFALLFLVMPTFAFGVWVYARFEERTLIKRLGRRVRGHLRRTAWVFPRLQLLLHVVAPPLFYWWLKFRVYHRERLPKNGPYIIVSSHRSYADPLFVACALRRFVNFVTTYQVMRGPFARWFFDALGSIPRKRHLRDVLAARQILRALADGAVVGVFPEGERSWTGAIGPLRREALELMRNQADIPIVPVRIDGNYAFWPRWRDKPQRARVRLTVLSPLTTSRYESLDSLAARLVAAFTPNDTDCTFSPPIAEGIERLLYRCLDCQAELALVATRGSVLKCTNCGAQYELTSRLTLRDLAHAGTPELALAAAYDTIRKSETTRLSPNKAQTIGVALESGERTVEHASEVRLYKELGNKLVLCQESDVLLTDQRLFAFDAGTNKVAFELQLKDTTSVTVEGNDRLQIQCGQLLELRFLKDSVLRWQNLVVNAVAVRKRRLPNRS